MYELTSHPNHTKPYQTKPYLQLSITTMLIHNATLLSCYFRKIATVSHFRLVLLKASLSMFNLLLIVSILVASVKMESVLHCINDKNCCDANCEAYGRKLWQIFAIFIPAVLCANDCLNGFEKCRKMAEKGLKPEPCESTKDGKPCTLL